MKSFLQFIEQITPLENEAKDAVLKSMKIETFPKNHILIPELSTCNKLYFIKKGLARAYFLIEDKEITDWFGMENMVIGPIIRKIPQKKGPHSVQLLEESELISIHFDELQKLYNQFHSIERLGRMLAIASIFHLQNRIDSLQFLDAKNRYLDFIEKYPCLINRISLGYIASYLGINQVTLSRIRKKI